MTRGNNFLVATFSLLGGLVALSPTACAPKNDPLGCPSVDPTGGDVTGAWTPATYCSAKYDPVTSNDWCSQLIYDANGVRLVMLGHPFLPLEPKTPEADLQTDPKLRADMTTHLSFTPAKMPPNDSNTYESVLIFGPVPTRTNFSKACLTAYGQTIPDGDCSVFQDALQSFLGDDGSAWQSFNLTPLMFQPNFFGHLPRPQYSNFTCDDDHAGGCTCSYDVSQQVKDVGTWSTDRMGILTLYSATEALPYDHDYAASATTLSISGLDGLDVMGQHGLRTVNWKK
jgi:hypothetical protein